MKRKEERKRKRKRREERVWRKRAYRIPQRSCPFWGDLGCRRVGLNVARDSQHQGKPGKGSTGNGINIWRSPELDSSEGFSASCEGSGGGGKPGFIWESPEQPAEPRLAEFRLHATHGVVPANCQLLFRSCVFCVVGGIPPRAWTFWGIWTTLLERNVLLYAYAARSNR